MAPTRLSNAESPVRGVTFAFDTVQNPGPVYATSLGSRGPQSTPEVRPSSTLKAEAAAAAGVTLR